ncbi:MAG: DUF2130 domain-containing protein [archaeon]|jgi:hypothetical protein
MIQNFECPLCHQKVSQKTFNEITGIWLAQKKAMAEFAEKKKKYQQQITQLKGANKQKIIALQSQLKNQISKSKEEYAKKMELLLDKEHKKQELLIKQKEAAIKKQLAKSIKSEFDIKAKQQKQLLEIKVSEKMQNFKEKESQMRRKMEISKQSAVRQLTSYQSKIGEQQKQIIALKNQLEKETTPSIEGLLEETVLLDRLKKEFPSDEFQHPGKGGDIIQIVKEKDVYIGKVLFECKKVKVFSKSHILQTAEAKMKRDADYGILVTNATSKNYKGFGQERGVIIVHPAGIIALVKILRENLLKIEQLKLNQSEKNEAIKRTLEYLEGPEFKNSLVDIVQQTIDLHESLRAEVKAHFKDWKNRLTCLERIKIKAELVENKTTTLLTKDQEVQKKETLLLPIPELNESKQ